MNHILVRETCHDLRKLAREALQGKWTDAVVATLIFGAVTMLPTALAGAFFSKDFAAIVSNIYMLAVQGPFTLGYTSFMLQLFRNEPTAPGDVFSGFERYGQAVLLYIVMGIFVVLWSLLLIVPGIIAMYRYRLAYYILLDNPNISVLDAINESKRLMTGNKGKLFLLDLSFIGWALLCGLTFGLGFVVLMPYISVASVAFYELANGNLKARPADSTYGLYVSEHSEGRDPENDPGKSEQA